MQKKPFVIPACVAVVLAVCLGLRVGPVSYTHLNVVNPDDIVNEYGADTMRLYEMFIGDFEKSAPWNSDSIKGCKRFLERIWSLQDVITPEEGYSPDLESGFHKVIKKVSEDIENLKFNTAIAAMMALLNDITNKGSITRGELRTWLSLLSPFATHIADEMWEIQGFEGMACTCLLYTSRCV